jgi:hypothetical protein
LCTQTLIFDISKANIERSEESKGIALTPRSGLIFLPFLLIGKSGIRTRDTLQYISLASQRFKPLSHISFVFFFKKTKKRKNQEVKATLKFFPILTFLYFFLSKIRLVFFFLLLFLFSRKEKETLLLLDLFI